MNPKQLQQMMLKAQKMQNDMQKKQQEIESEEFNGTAGGGVVSITMTGDKKIKKIDISEDLLEPSEKDMLEELLTIAINDAQDKIDKKMDDEIGSMTKGMPGF